MKLIPAITKGKGLMSYIKKVVPMKDYRLYMEMESVENMRRGGAGIHLSLVIWCNERIKVTAKDLLRLQPCNPFYV